MTSYKIKIKNFEGPLDLLLKLIEKEKLDISEISLAKITEEYINYIDTLSSDYSDYLSDFIAIAAKLILIKSKLLIPEIDDQDEDDEISAEDLKARLLEYKKFKNLSKKLGNRYSNYPYNFSKSNFTNNNSLFSPGKKLSLSLLQEKMNNIQSLFEQFKDPPKKKLIDKISIKDKILHLRTELQKLKNLNFTSFRKTTKSNTEVIVSFLAILEMTKNKHITTSQKNNFSDIIITKNLTNETNTPINQS